MIRATLYMEVEPSVLEQLMARTIIRRAFEIEAEQHGYMLDGEMLEEEGTRPGFRLLAHAVKDRS